MDRHQRPRSKRYWIVSNGSPSVEDVSIENNNIKSIIDKCINASSGLVPLRFLDQTMARVDLRHTYRPFLGPLSGPWGMHLDEFIAANALVCIQFIIAHRNLAILIFGCVFFSSFTYFSSPFPHLSPSHFPLSPSIVNDSHAHPISTSLYPFTIATDTHPCRYPHSTLDTVSLATARPNIHWSFILTMSALFQPRSGSRSTITSCRGWSKNIQEKFRLVPKTRPTVLRQNNRRCIRSQLFLIWHFHMAIPLTSGHC